jgi:hypothetical protein
MSAARRMVAMIVISSPLLSIVVDRHRYTRRVMISLQRFIKP